MLEIYINSGKRTIALASDDYVLLLTDPGPSENSMYASNAGSNSSSTSIHSHGHNHGHGIGHNRRSSTSVDHHTNGHNEQNECLIEFVPKGSVSLNTFAKVNKEVYGFLGLIALKGTIYAGFITNEQEVGSVVPNVTIKRLISTMFINLNGDIFNITPQQQFLQFQLLEGSLEYLDTPITNSKIASIMKLLETGTFYYSHDKDISIKVQDWNVNFTSDYTVTEDLQDDYAGRFVWNTNLINELSIFRNRLSDDERMYFDKGNFFITLIRGFVQRRQLPNCSPNSSMTLITRQDCRKIGYLFGPVCMDEEGNVANFAETEIIIQTDTHIISYSLLKGNIPLFWKLDSHLMSTKIDFLRSNDASKHAFNRFFETLCSEYNMVYTLDALSNKGSQPELSKRFFNVLNEFREHHPELPVEYKKLPNHQSFGEKLVGKLDYFGVQLQDQQIISALEDYYTFQYDIKERKQLSRQLGTFFVTTLDSNERSNIIEYKLSCMILEHVFGPEFAGSIWEIHSSLWDANAQAIGKISKTYSNSIKTATKTGGIIGKVAEQGKKYAGQSKKYVSNSFAPTSSTSGRQNQLDKLLGRKNIEVQVKLIDPIHDYVLEGLNNRRSEFTTFKDLIIYNVTMNVAATLYDGDLTPLVYPEPENFLNYDIIAIALEEIIELTPSKVKAIDLRARNFWERKLKDTINGKGNNEYTLLRGEQLGGVLLLIYVSTDIGDSIKNVETCFKKTGFKGISANKGAVGITFTFSRHSRLCFVASHLAAGQSHSEERHKNFKTIFKGLTFKKCKNIKDADILFWMGDLNYRISLPSDTVRKILKYDPPKYSTKYQNQSYDSIVSEGSDYISSDGYASNAALGASESKLDDLLQQVETNIEEKNKEDLLRTIKLEHNNNNDDDDDNNKTLVRARKPPKDYENEVKLTVHNSSETNSDAKIQSLESFSQLSLNEEEDRRLAHLFEYDQLNQQMFNGKSFPFFDEMEIHFKPTYKFDRGTDNYDTSEKQRVPSWTDRILVYSKNKRLTELEQLRYNSISQIKFSDHKPVYGIFHAKMEIVDDTAKNKIEKQLYEMAKQKLYANRSNYGDFKPLTSNRYISGTRFNTDIDQELPEPSSKTQRWWITNDPEALKLGNENAGKTKIRFPELDSGMFKINPNYPKNPFVKTNEPRFIEK
ncbi:hypothetical protein CANINC_004758 [Pichia inconspicua]|uniref:phosphoinositide 5-phosphatase n=1 Tax=Pichia inconspicua TaxID=52247 RepID=A0A4T0WWS2_9ASCO|nr:hypothetical protein CANINC_004758 [[Candida] inconspicua]